MPQTSESATVPHSAVVLTKQWLHFPPPSVPYTLSCSHYLLCIWFNFSTNWWETDKAQNVLKYLEILWGLRWKSPRMFIARIEAMSLHFSDPKAFPKSVLVQKSAASSENPCGKLPTPFASLWRLEGWRKWEGSWRSMCDGQYVMYYNEDYLSHVLWDSCAHVIFINALTRIRSESFILIQENRVWRRQGCVTWLLPGASWTLAITLDSL